MTFRKINLALGLLCTLLLAVGCPTSNGPAKEAVKRVASMDEEAIYQLPMFTEAEKGLNEWAENRTKELRKEAESKDEEGQRQLFQQYQLELQKKTNETMNPLKEKARAAVAMAAKEKGVTVVLDKKIVVFGVPDITEDITSKLTSGEELTYPEEESSDKSPIGYFDQNVIRSLKVFKEAELEIVAERNKMIQELQKKLGKNPTPQEQEAARKQITLHVESLQQSKMGPLFKAVTDSVADVAKAEGLSLVVDTQHVMHGGRNLTELVVDSFLKRVSGDGDASEAAPEATASPKGE